MTGSVADANRNNRPNVTETEGCKTRAITIPLSRPTEMEGKGVNI